MKTQIFMFSYVGDDGEPVVISQMLAVPHFGEVD
jgi:hypothetical protein